MALVKKDTFVVMMALVKKDTFVVMMALVKNDTFRVMMALVKNVTFMVMLALVKILWPRISLNDDGEEWFWKLKSDGKNFNFASTCENKTT